MKIIFIRHGEPDKTEVDKRGFIGQGRDMAHLTELGVKQAEMVSLNPLLKGGQVIVSSPYTRALQTAAIISKNTGLDIKVEVDIHEFIPDKTFQLKGEEENKRFQFFMFQIIFYCIFFKIFIVLSTHEKSHPFCLFYCNLFHEIFHV